MIRNDTAMAQISDHSVRRGNDEVDRITGDVGWLDGVLNAIELTAAAGLARRSCRHGRRNLHTR